MEEARERREEKERERCREGGMRERRSMNMHNFDTRVQVLVVLLVVKERHVRIGRLLIMSQLVIMLWL